MLAGLMENNYDRMWRFKEFFEHSSKICDLKYINVMNLDRCQIVEIPMRKEEKYLVKYFTKKIKASNKKNFIKKNNNNNRISDMKNLIHRETRIDPNSQLIIFNNLLIDSLVTEQQAVETYPIMDRQHPCILFSLNSSLSCDNLEIIKPSKN